MTDIYMCEANDNITPNNGNTTMTGTKKQFTVNHFNTPNDRREISRKEVSDIIRQHRRNGGYIHIIGTDKRTNRYMINHVEFRPVR